MSVDDKKGQNYVHIVYECPLSPICKNKHKEIHIVCLLPSRMAFNSVREGSKSFSPLTADPGGNKFDTTDLNELV